MTVEDYNSKSEESVEIENWTKRIDKLLQNTATETQYYDFKQGFFKLDNSSEKQQLNHFNKNVYEFVKVLTSCANNKLGKTGFVIVGISDGFNSANRIKELYGIDSCHNVSWNNNFYITGLQGEIDKFFNGKLDSLQRKVLDQIKQMPIDGFYKEYIINHSGFIIYENKPLFLFRLEPKIGESVRFENRLWKRVGEETKVVPLEGESMFMSISQSLPSMDYDDFDNMKNYCVKLQYKHIYSSEVIDSFRNTIEELKKQKALLEEEVSKLPEQERRAYELGYLKGISNYLEFKDEHFTISTKDSFLQDVNNFLFLSQEAKYQRIIGFLLEEQGYNEEAFVWLLRAANLNDPKALNEIGLFYEKGILVKQNFEMAFRYYSKAVVYDSDDSDILYNLALCYDYGRGIDHNYEIAFELYSKSANMGNYSAQNNLAVCFLEGKGVKVDDKKAFEWFLKSAKQGCAIAQNSVGEFYYDGRVVEQDYHIAFEWFAKSANQGFPRAKYNLGDCYYYALGVPRDYEKAFNFYSDCVRDGEKDGLVELAKCYLYGYGVSKNVEQAKVLFNECCENNNPCGFGYLAMIYYCDNDYDSAFSYAVKANDLGDYLGKYYLGLCYYLGVGTEQSFSNAYDCFNQVVQEKEWERALTQLAECYFYGLGVDLNYETAFDLYKRSAKKDHPWGTHRLGECYWKGLGCEKDPEKAFACFKKADSLGWDDAKYDIAICYYTGLGVVRDYNKAFALFEILAKQGNRDAQSMLAECYREGLGVEVNIDSAIYWYKMAAENGDSYSQNAFGVLLDKYQRYSEAIEWYDRAIRNGSKMAIYNLGVCFLMGKGVDVDLIKAQVYIEDALLYENVRNTIIEDARNGSEEEMKALEFVGVEY